MRPAFISQRFWPSFSNDPIPEVPLARGGMGLSHQHEGGGDAGTGAGSAILGKPEYSTLPRLDIPAQYAISKSFTAEQSSRTHRKPNQLPSKSSSHHVFQQLNHFPSPSPGLSFGWREIVERLAGGDGSPQHRCPWTTLTTSHG